MSRFGSISVECEEDDCYALVEYEAAALDEHGGLEDALRADGWARKDGSDYCPECSKAENPRERGDDDGVEYEHPSDYVKGIE